MKPTLTRRALLGGIAASATTAILAACGGSTKDPTPSAATNTPGAAPTTAPAGGTSGTAVTGVGAIATQVANRGNATATPGIGPTSTAAPPAVTGTAASASTATRVTTVATPSASGAGAVYALTNQESTNAVAVFARSADGKLTMMTTVPTGGKGIGDQSDTEGLGSQGALALSQDGKLLFAVNGGSGDISVFIAEGNTLSFVTKVPSNGPRPISLTVHGDMLYALNYDRQKPGKGNITGFTIGRSNTLTPIANSTKSLSSNGNVDPGQVLFSPKGDLLVVTEKATNKIVTYPVGSDGVAGGPNVQASGGEAPFSLTFVSDTLLVTADNFGDAAGKGAASSFTVGDKGTLKLVSKAVPAKLTGACWIVATGDGKWVYVANTGSGVISGYKVGQDGSIALLNADGITARAGKKPRDLALSGDNKYLYAFDTVGGNVQAFAVQTDGKLESLGTAGTIPAPGGNGLVAR
ncbi:MAG: beta-propeller fold lactonase family protein [Thermomicrobia bacterium]|nr:beta-propeller fold lactonase family protein [Thermomicrobia bacterium]